MVKNLYVPLRDDVYEQLRATAKRSRVPASALARDAIETWLRQQAHTARSKAIAADASEMAGKRLDLDPDLEEAGIKHLVDSPI